jgi:hypothetical protein
MHDFPTTARLVLAGTSDATTMKKKEQAGLPLTRQIAHVSTSVPMN